MGQAQPVSFAALCAIAYKTERVRSRRLAKQQNLSEADALQQTLTQVAGAQTLAELMAERRQQSAHTETRRLLRKQLQTQALEHKRAGQQPDPAAWLAWFDGATKPNPGRMGIGGLLQSPDGRTIEISYAAGHGDSNEAEYLALIAVLEIAVRMQPDQLVVIGDSRVVLDAMRAAVPVVSTEIDCVLQRHRQQAMQLATQLKSVAYLWVPRAKNTVADALSQQALSGNAANRSDCAYTA